MTLLTVYMWHTAACLLDFTLDFTPQVYLLIANAYGRVIPNGTLILIVLAPRHHRFIKVQQASRTLQFCLYALLGLSSRYAATTELSVPTGYEPKSITKTVKAGPLQA